MNEPDLDWSEDEREAFGVYRQALSPSDAQIKAALGGLSASLGLALVDTASVAQAGISQAPLSGVGPAASAVKGTAGVLDLAARTALAKASVGALVVVGAVAAYAVLEPLAPSPEVPSGPAAAVVAPTPASSTAVAPAEAIQDAPAEVIASEPDAPPRPSVQEARRSVAPVQVAAPGPPKSPPVQEELGAVRRAQSALAAGDPEQALELMETLGQTNAVGSLLVERELTRVLALCALGRVAEARAAAGRVEQLPGGAAYRTRLAGSCAGTSESPAPE